MFRWTYRNVKNPQIENDPNILMFLRQGNNFHSLYLFSLHVGDTLGHLVDIVIGLEYTIKKKFKNLNTKTCQSSRSLLSLEVGWMPLLYPGAERNITQHRSFAKINKSLMTF